MNESTSIVPVRPIGPALADSGEAILSDTRRLARLPVLADAGAGPPTAINPGAVLPGQSVGRFQIERELGRGGMGVVLLAHDPALDRPVALKLLRVEDPQTLARFRLEAHALAGLVHPNAVRVYEFGEHAGRPYLAMEYVAGRSLFAALRDGPLDPRRAAGLVAAVAGAVHAAHKAGVVHRDLKPANVLLDAADAPRLTDFGIAKELAGPAGLTETNAVVGTPAYMAPEQAAGHAADRRTDVYGLGATLYECLTGRPPFVGPTLVVLNQVAGDDPVPPGRLNRAVPRDLETVCLKCLAKDPARRYPTAADVAADLGRVVRGEPVYARPTGRVERAVRWGRRHKAVAALSAVAVLSLVGGAGAAGWQAVRATAARDAEAGQRVVAEAKTVEAEADRRRAEEKADEAAAINTFLLDDLLRQASSTTQANAQFEPDPALTVRAALDRAAGRVGERFKDRPVTEQAVRLALGDAYRGVGEFAKAADQYRPAFESRRGRLGPAHADTLTVMFRLGATGVSAGRAAETVPLLEDCLRLHREALGPTHSDTLYAMMGLAHAYKLVGRPADAVRQLEECLRSARAAAGPTHIDTLSATAHLASALKAAGRPAEALPLYEDAFRLVRDQLGPDHPDTLTVMSNLARAYQGEGRVAESVALQEECLRLKRVKLGPDHPNTLISLGNLGSAYLAAGRKGEAVAAHEECLRLRRARLGPDHPMTLVALANLAQAHTAAGRPAEALPLHQEGLRLARAKLGSDNPTTLSLINNVGTALNALNRHAEAVPLHEECARTRRANLGVAHPDTLASMNNLGTTYRRAGRPAEAVPVLEDCLRLRRAKPGPANLDTLVTSHGLALAYLAVDRPADAAPLFEAVWRGRSARRSDDPEAAEARSGLGACLLRLGRFAEAEPHLLAHYDALRQAKVVPAERVAKARERLGELYGKWGKPAEAAKWQPVGSDRAEMAPPPRRVPAG